jgi:methionyl-tRNA formyltransferase
MHKVNQLLSFIALRCIDLYQATLSPDKSPVFRHFLKGRVCAHEPHCSAYGRECFEKYPFFTAVHYTMERVATCVPRFEKQYDPSSYRVVFFSSSPIGVPFLQHLADDPRFDLVGVVTMPDAPVGRGMKVQENIIKVESWKLNVENNILTPRSLRLDSKKYAADAQAFQQWASDLKPDLFVVIAYGHIMPQRVLDIPVFGSINVHGSLLPEYRGASPLQSVFLDGKSETGLTIMKMDAGVDTWGMIKKTKTALPLSRTVIDLIAWIKQVWPKFLNDTLWQWGKWLVEAEAQDETKASLCRKFEKEDGLIDPFQDGMLEVRQKRQAFALWPKLYFFWEGKRITISTFTLHASVSRLTLQWAPLISHIWSTYQLHPAVQEIGLLPEGKKLLSWEQFVHGYLHN